MNDARTPPHDLEAERAVIGATMVFGDGAMAVASGLRADDFFDPGCREAWAGVIELEKRGKNVNSIGLADELKARGMAARFQPSPLEWLLDCAGKASVLEVLPHHLGIVRAKATLRGLIELCTHVAAMAYGDQNADETLAIAREGVARLEVADDTMGPPKVGDLLPAALEIIEGRVSTGEDPNAIKTGIETLDEILGGGKPGQLILIAGRPGDGKSSLGSNIATNQALLKDPCLMFSAEMQNQEVVERLLGLQAQVSIHRIGRGRIEYSEWRKIITGAGQLSEAPLFLDDRPHTIAQMMGHARRWHAKEVRGKGKTRCSIVIDYAQLIQVDASFDATTQEREISIVSGQCKRLAKTLKCPVYLITQLNREVAKRGGPPVITDLRGSGALEQDADVVIFVYRDVPMDKTAERNKSGPAQLIIGKHRGGPTGVAHANWIREFMQFTAAGSDSDGEDHPPQWTGPPNWQDGREP